MVSPTSLSPKIVLVVTWRPRIHGTLGLETDLSELTPWIELRMQKQVWNNCRCLRSEGKIYFEVVSILMTFEISTTDRCVVTIIMMLNSEKSQNYHFQARIIKMAIFRKIGKITYEIFRKNLKIHPSYHCSDFRSKWQFGLKNETFDFFSKFSLNKMILTQTSPKDFWIMSHDDVVNVQL